MEKKKLILLLPLSLAFFSLCRDKAHSLLNAAGRDGFSFGELKIPCGILRFTSIGAEADNFHVSRQDGVQEHGQERTDGVRRGQ